MNAQRIVVIGLGYVGLPLAVTGPQNATTDMTLDFVAEQTANN